ncbi:MAG: hypothetical protein HOE64_17135 [Nitrospina sp.]|jgi:hypothetical protein|nr:hypothetical protein [Nitrospina sp.]
MNIKTYIRKYKGTLKNKPDWCTPLVKCKDGFEMSVQESPNHYSGYGSVEVGFPSSKESLLMPFAQQPKTPTKTVYGHVPVEVIDEVILKHGGIHA